MKYVVEHLEGPLERWATLEYIHMCECIGDANLKFTNFPEDGGQPLDFARISNTKFHPELTSSKMKKTAVMHVRFDSVNIHVFGTRRLLKVWLFSVSESLNELKGSMDWTRTCLLDMNAEEPLAPTDKFEVVVFGGILGNVPSDDRTSEIRKFDFVHRRHLGPVQMTTDTAILVSKLVLEDNIPLDSIPYIDSPELQVASKEFIELPFRFVAKSYFTNDETDRDTPVIAKGLVDHLKTCNDW